VAQYLAALEAEAPEGADAGGEPDTKRPRRHERQPPEVISPSDPQSAWRAKANKRLQFGYGLNCLIDIENAVIVDVEARWLAPMMKLPQPKRSWIKRRSISL
jgi:hypothetical protein